MAGRVVLYVNSGGYEAAWQAASIGVTAAAMGDEVLFVFGFDALRALAEGRFGEPHGVADAVTRDRGLEIGAPAPAAMLADARALGARLLACDTTVRLSGLKPDQLEATKALDEVLGLPQLWRLTREALVFTM
jgi:peroxiredoxin family protein